MMLQLELRVTRNDSEVMAQVYLHNTETTANLLHCGKIPKDFVDLVKQPPVADDGII